MSKKNNLKDKIKNLENEMTRADSPVDVPLKAVNGFHTLTDRILQVTTETEGIENRLDIDESMFRIISESSPYAIIITDSEYYLRYWSLGAKKVFGYDESEVINRPSEILIPESDRERDRYYRNLFLKTGAPLFMGKMIETQALRKDGRIIPVEIYITSVRIKRQSYFYQIICDISERKEIEAALQAGEEKFRRIFQESPIGIALYDKDFVLVNANKNCRC